MCATILLVVEDASFLQHLSGNLQKQVNTSVLTAGSKHEALELCSNQEIDMALLDIRRKGKDVLQVLARLKKNQPETEVLLLSDAKHIALAMEGMQQGAADDISVPFDIDSFIKTIKSALRRKKARTKAGRKRKLLNIFADTMVAATFAEAGEFETAQEMYSDNDKEEKSTDIAGSKPKRRTP